MNASNTAAMNPLQRLVAFEKQVKDVQITSPVRARLLGDGNRIELAHRGAHYRGFLGRPLIHQVGRRIWPDAVDNAAVEARWSAESAAHPRDLEGEISRAFAENDLAIRYYVEGAGNTIYGVVSPYFVKINQIDFRNTFIEETKRVAALVPVTGGIRFGYYGQVVEDFMFDSPGFQTGMKYGLVYAKNNGHDAYKVNWGREILVCTNGLTRWDGPQFKWNHTSVVDVKTFVAKTITDGVEHQRHLEERIHARRSTDLDNEMLGELQDRVSLAQSVQNRLLHQLSVEARELGNTEWALCQAATYLGTHGKWLDNPTKRDLIGLGTDVLEESLSAYLERTSSARMEWFHGYRAYGLLVPRYFQPVH